MSNYKEDQDKAVKAMLVYSEAKDEYDRLISEVMNLPGDKKQAPPLTAQHMQKIRDAQKRKEKAQKEWVEAQQDLGLL